MMENSIVFYHFTTKDSLDSSNLSRSSIAFCKETKTIFTDDIEYLSFNWTEMPSIDRPIVSSGILVINEGSATIEGDVCVFSDPTYNIDKSTLIIP